MRPVVARTKPNAQEGCTMNAVSRTWRFVGVSLMVALALPMLAGCQTTLRQERDALWRENSELRDSAVRLQAELASLQREMDQLAREAADLRSRPAPEPVIIEKPVPVPAASVTPIVNTPVNPPAASANTGFESIAGIESSRHGNDVSVTLPNNVLFASGSATLTSDSRRTLQQVTNVLMRQYRGSHLRIVGHSDSDPIRKSSWRDNYHLSEARASAVRDLLATQGIPPTAMSVVGRGPDQPVASNSTAAGKAKNRRVEIIVTP